MAGWCGGDDAVFLRRQEQHTPRRRRREPPPPLSALHQHHYQPEPYQYHYVLQSPGYHTSVDPPQRPFQPEHADMVMADDSPLTAATTNLELTDGEAEGEASPAPETVPSAEVGVVKKRQKRNKPTLSCFECVERKTKVRIGA
jgi:hypothetical protein